MTTRSLRSRKALGETEVATAINVRSENSVMGGGEANDLDGGSVSGGEQQEDSGQDRERLDR
jgi:hypothetical protein